MRGTGAGTLGGGSSLRKGISQKTVDEWNTKEETMQKEY